MTTTERLSAIREALEDARITTRDSRMIDQALAHTDALEAELKGEPVAWMSFGAKDEDGVWFPDGVMIRNPFFPIPLYAHPTHSAASPWILVSERLPVEDGDDSDIEEWARREAHARCPEPMIEHYATLEEWRNAIDAYPAYVKGYAAGLIAARQQDHATIAQLRDEVERLKGAGDALDHKFIDLVAFCAANIPKNKLQELVDDWAGHDERKAWKEAAVDSEKEARPSRA